MRARAGDPPRTMAQKILAGRSSDPTLVAESIEVKVDQVVLSREPHLAVAEAERLGMKKASVEVAVAYDTHCVSAATDAETPGLRSALNYGMLVARPGIGRVGEQEDQEAGALHGGRRSGKLPRV